MKLAHIALFAEDMETMKVFFTAYFGCTAGTLYNNPRTGFRSYFLRFPEGGVLELMQWDMARPAPEGRHIGPDHIAVSLGSREAVDALTARLCADGYPLLSPPRTTGDGYYESCILGPDSLRLELTV